MYIFSDDFAVEADSQTVREYCRVSRSDCTFRLVRYKKEKTIDNNSVFRCLTTAVL